MRILIAGRGVQTLCNVVKLYLLISIERYIKKERAI